MNPLKRQKLSLLYLEELLIHDSNSIHPVVIELKNGWVDCFIENICVWV